MQQCAAQKRKSKLKSPKTFYTHSYRGRSVLLCFIILFYFFKSEAMRGTTKGCDVSVNKTDSKLSEMIIRPLGGVFSLMMPSRSFEQKERKSQNRTKTVTKQPEKHRL